MGLTFNYTVYWRWQVIGVACGLLLFTTTLAAPRCETYFIASVSQREIREQRALQNLKPFVSQDVQNLVRDVETQLMGGKKSYSYENSLRWTRDLLQKELDGYVLGKISATLNTRIKIKIKILRGLLEELDALSRNEVGHFNDLIFPTAMALDLTSANWRYSLFRNDSLVKKLKEFSSAPDPKLLQEYKKLFSIERDFIGKGFLQLIETHNFGWTPVPTNLVLSVEDLLYLNLHQIAPVWATSQKHAVDGVKLDPLQLFTHDLVHYGRQIGYYRGAWDTFQKGTEIQLDQIRSLLVDILSKKADTVSATAAFFMTHEKIENITDFLGNIKYIKRRFLEENDLGHLYQVYYQQTGRSLDEFMDDIRKFLLENFSKKDRHITNPVMPNLQTN